MKNKEVCAPKDKKFKLRKVVSLETAKKLVEAGIVLEAELSYNPNTKGIGTPYCPTERIEGYTLEERKDKPWDSYYAPDIAGLLEALPRRIEVMGYACWLTIGTNIEHFYCSYAPANDSSYEPLIDAFKLPPLYDGKEITEILSQLLIWVKTKAGE
jgi:hypothetical protein